MKLLIKLRKKTLLPLKWWRQKRKITRNLAVREKAEIIGKMGELRANIVRLQRLEDKDKLNLEIGKLAALKWVLLDVTK